MVEALPVRHRLPGISPKAYEHPADRAATAALQAIPGLDAVVRRLIEFRYERAFRQTLLATSVKLGSDQLPEVWQVYEEVLDILDMPDVYDLYLTQHPFANAAAIGAGKPIVLLHSGVVSLTDREELRTVLAHEVAHILSNHVLYRTALLVLLNLGASVRLPLFAGLPVLAIRGALHEWSRASELSCDRAATLVNRDPLTTCRTMMVMAGGVESRRLNLDAFLRQAAAYEEWDSEWDRLTRLFSELSQTHGYPVRRVAEIMRWVRSGDYGHTLDGDYPRRDERADPRIEATDAYDFYTGRFREIFQDAGETVASARERFDAWLRKHEREEG